MKLLPFEKMKPCTDYAFTFCVAQDGDGALGQRVAHNIAFLKKYMKHCHFVLYPELSNKGRLHYHGIIWYESYRHIFLFNLEVMPYLCQGNADIEIDTICRDWGTRGIYWQLYVKKSKHLIKPYMTKMRIMYKIDSSRLPATSFGTPKELFKNTLDW